MNDRITAVSAVEYLTMARDSLIALANELDSFTPTEIQNVIEEQITAIMNAVHKLYAPDGEAAKAESIRRIAIGARLEDIQQQLGQVCGAVEMLKADILTGSVEQ